MAYINHWIPAFAGMTTGVGMGLSPFRYPFAIPDKIADAAPTVIPAKAGIQGGGAGVLDGLRFLPACQNNASVVIPALREWLT